MKTIARIIGPSKIDGTKTVSFSGHISERLSKMLVRAEPHKDNVVLRECGAKGHSDKAWLQGHGKSGHLTDRLRQKAPQRYFTFILTLATDAPPLTCFFLN